VTWYRRRDPEVWSEIERAVDLLAEQQDSLPTVTPMERSPVYLGQYAELHQALNAESDRRRNQGEPPLRILDWGAGYGHCGLVRALHGDDVVFHSLAEDDVALHVSAIDRVAELAGADVLLANDPVHIDLDDDSVDIVVSAGVLEHVHEGGGDVDASLAEIARVLRPGGLFLCAHLPSKYSWIEATHGVMRRPRHDRRFSRRVVEAHLARAGLVTELSRFYGAVPRNGFAARATRTGTNTIERAARLDAIDRWCSTVAGPLSQNQLIIARKPSAGGG